MTIDHEIRPSRLAPVILSLVFRPETRGHLYGYHDSVGKAAQRNGWKHVVALPKSWGKVAQQLPDNWIVCLQAQNATVNTSRIRSFKGAFQLGNSLAKFLRSKIDARVPTIIFAETFAFWEIPAIVLSLFRVPKSNLSLWLLFRFKLDFQSIGQRALRKYVFPLIEYILEPGHLQLLTDSESLKETIRKAFKRDLTVMPIPHTEDIVHSTVGRRKNRTHHLIRCWFPGEPRKDKGIEVIRNIISTRSRESRRILMILGESSFLKEVPGGPKIELIPDHVDRAVYLKLLRKSNIVLLPYEAARYAESTSGIFIEAVIAGSIPLVTPATWMAAELQRYGLQQLITDWQPAKVIPTILAVCRDYEIASRLEAMSRQYSLFHSIDSYALKMKDLLESTDVKHRETKTREHRESAAVM